MCSVVWFHLRPINSQTSAGHLRVSSSCIVESIYTVGIEDEMTGKSCHLKFKNDTVSGLTNYECSKALRYWNNIILAEKYSEVYLG